MQSRKNIFVLEKQNSVKSNIPPHFQEQFQREFRNRAQKHNSVTTECQKRKYLLQIIKYINYKVNCCKIIFIKIAI